MSGDRTEEGAVMATVAVFMVALLAVVALVYDGGRAITAKRRAINQAEQAARAGARAVDPASLRTAGATAPGVAPRLDPAGAAAQARAYLAASGSAGTVQVAGDTVQVTVTFQERTLLLGLLGIDSFSGSGTAEAVSVRGVGGEDP
jgi:Flp pilus assembly protein TadG